MDENPFVDLPAALVQEVLEKTEDISITLLNSFDDVNNHRAKWRYDLKKENLVFKEGDLPVVHSPTCLGIDGSHAIERLLAIDLIAVGAVAVEGLTPPSEQRYWPEPYHQIYVDTEAHEADTSTLLRAIMAGMELSLAVNAPHELVFLDGSFTTPTIFFNQAINKLKNTRHLKISRELNNNIREYFSAYKKILNASRSDRYWIALPKYTTKREIGAKMDWPNSYDDRGLLSTILEAGEYTKPIFLHKPEDSWHINTAPIESLDKNEIRGMVNEILELLNNNNIFVTYYRPYSYLPAFRVEMTSSVANTPSRLSTVLSGIRFQCGSAAILEPYPLYMADRMVKHLAKSIPAFRQIASQRVAKNYAGDIGEIFLSLHGYRTESGA